MVSLMRLPPGTSADICGNKKPIVSKKPYVKVLLQVIVRDSPLQLPSHLLTLLHLYMTRYSLQERDRSTSRDISDMTVSE